MRLKVTLLALTALVAAMTSAYASNPVRLYQMNYLFGDGRIWTSDNVTSPPYDHGTLGYSYSDMNVEHYIDGTWSEGLSPLTEMYNSSTRDMYLTTVSDEVKRFQAMDYDTIPLGYVSTVPKDNYIPIYVRTRAGMHAFSDNAHITRLGPGWGKKSIAFYIYHTGKPQSPTDVPLVAGTLYQDIDSPYYIATSPYAATAYLEANLISDGYTNYSQLNTIDSTNQNTESQVDILQDQSGTYYYDTVECLSGSTEYSKYISSPYSFTNETSIGWAYPTDTPGNYTEIFEYFNTNTHQHQYGTSAQTSGLTAPWSATGAVFWIHS